MAILLPLGIIIVVVTLVAGFIIGSGALVLLLLKNILFGTLGAVIVRFVGSKIFKKKGKGLTKKK